MDLLSAHVPAIATTAVSLASFLADWTNGAFVEMGPRSVQLWLGAGCAAGLVLIITPLLIRRAHRWGWVDHPKHDRWHSRPVALMGGIAIVAAGAAAILLSGAYTAFPWPVWVAVVLVFGAGLADDLFDVQPEAKIIVQVMATVLLLYAGYAFWRGGPFWVSIPLTFFWVIGITNALNLIDGMDGLAAGIAAIAATVLAAVAWVIGDVGMASVAAIVAAAAGAFLVFNFQPARIFMGDCGSMVLGFLLAAVAMSVQGRGGPTTATLAPTVILAVPIFDTAFVTVTRILSGKSVTEGGTDHTMHRLVMLGLSERRAVLFLYAVSLIFGLGALGVYWAPAPLFFSFLLLGAVAAVVFGLYLAQAQSYPDQSLRVSIQDTTVSQRFGAVMRAVGGGVAWKSVAGAMADLLVAGAAFVAAYHLRFDPVPPTEHWEVMMQALPAVMAAKIGLFYLFRLYHGIWRHAGTPELVRLVGASTVASVATWTGLLVLFGPDRLSPAVIVLDWLLCTIAIGGVRFGFRGLRQYFASHRNSGRRVVIIGTGTTSVLALRYLRQSDDVQRTAVGFLDADAHREGLRLQGLRVLGTPRDLSAVIEAHDVDEVILPSSDVPPAQRELIRATCQREGVPCQYFSVQLHPAPIRRFTSSAGDGASGGDPARSSDASGSSGASDASSSPYPSDSDDTSSPPYPSDSDGTEEISG